MGLGIDRGHMSRAIAALGRGQGLEGIDGQIWATSERVSGQIWPAGSDIRGHAGIRPLVPYFGFDYIFGAAM